MLAFPPRVVRKLIPTLSILRSLFRIGITNSVKKLVMKDSSKGIST